MIEISGVYRFYVDGELVATQKNVITTEGKKAILRYLAGQTQALGESVALGTGAVAASASDSRLTFEVSRANVLVKSVDYTNFFVLFKTTLPLDDVYNIYEVGLWTADTNNIAGAYGSRLISTFDTSVETWSNISLDSTNARTSADAARVDVAASSTVSVRNSSISMDLSGYSGSDTFLVAFYKPDNNVVGITLSFEDQNSGGSLKSPEQNISTLPVGYNVISVAKSAFVATGTINWNSINRYGLDVRAGATGSYITLDGIRIEDTDTINQDYVLVSRTVLGTPLAKTAVAPMDIEYALEFNIT